MSSIQVPLSAAFKAQISKTIFAIVFFVLIYLLLFTLSMGLTVLCVYWGVSIILAAPKLITIVLGIGLASLGFLILIFLLKFMFKSHKIDRSHLVEIKRQEQPDLFALIDGIVAEVGTQAPKKVYLSADVNASVFYDSSFWSMFFPVRKNLHIGMGLVTTSTRAELKAVLAHEFGHFSQRSMKLGSYVYNVNQVIFNMLYDNGSYQKLVEGWASISGLISIFVVLAVHIIEGIQWILQQVYALVNKNYMALSREMEFHADTIAAHVVGAEPLISSLLRMPLADEAFNEVQVYYQKRIGDCEISCNFYKEQAFAMQYIAETNAFPMAHGYPQITLDRVHKFNKSKLVIKDQWASHPATEDRVAHLQHLDLPILEQDHSPANTLFNNLEEVQERLTRKIFEGVQFSQDPIPVSLERFTADYKKDVDNRRFPKIFNGYYDDKDPLELDLEAPRILTEQKQLSELFSDAWVDKVYTALALGNDLQTIKQIAEKGSGIKSFDYDGVRYSRKKTAGLIEDIEKKWKNLLADIKDNDAIIFAFFRQLERDTPKSGTLSRLYGAYYEFDAAYEERLQVYPKLQEKLQFLNLVIPIDEINANFRRITHLEKQLKTGIGTVLEDPYIQDEISTDMKNTFDIYLGERLRYFGNERYNEDNLGILFGSMDYYVYLMQRSYFSRKKEILEYQSSLLSSQKTPLLPSE